MAHVGSFTYVAYVSWHHSNIAVGHAYSVGVLILDEACHTEGDVPSSIADPDLRADLGSAIHFVYTIRTSFLNAPCFSGLGCTQSHHVGSFSRISMCTLFVRLAHVSAPLRGHKIDLHVV